MALLVLPNNKRGWNIFQNKLTLVRYLQRCFNRYARIPTERTIWNIFNKATIIVYWNIQLRKLIVTNNQMIRLFSHAISPVSVKIECINNFNENCFSVFLFEARSCQCRIPDHILLHSKILRISFCQSRNHFIRLGVFPRNIICLGFRKDISNPGFLEEILYSQIPDIQNKIWRIWESYLSRNPEEILSIPGFQE